MARAKSVGLGFNHTVITGWQVREAERAVRGGGGGGGLHTQGVGITVNVVSVDIFERHGHTRQARVASVLDVIGVQVFEDQTVDRVTKFTKGITRTLHTCPKRDARDRVVGKGSGGYAIGVFAVVITGGLGFGDRVRAREQVRDRPNAVRVGRCGLGDRQVIGIRPSDGHGCTSQTRFASLLHAVVVIITVDRTRQTRGDLTKLGGGRWYSRHDRDRCRVAWVLARAVPDWLGLGDCVIACGLWWEAVAAVESGGCGGDDIACAVFQGHGDATNARLAVVYTVAVKVFVDPTSDW